MSAPPCCPCHVYEGLEKVWLRWLEDQIDGVRRFMVIQVLVAQEGLNPSWICALGGGLLEKILPCAYRNLHIFTCTWILCGFAHHCDSLAQMHHPKYLVGVTQFLNQNYGTRWAINNLGWILHVLLFPAVFNPSAAQLVGLRHLLA